MKTENGPGVYHCILVMVALASVFTGCSFDRQTKGRGTMILAMNSHSLARTLMPGIDISVDSYDIDGSGPDNTSFSVKSMRGTTYSRESIIEGIWNITVIGKNKNGNIVAGATQEITISAGKNTEVNIQCVPFSGTGALNLFLSWPTNTIDTPEVAATLTSLADAESRSLDFSILNENASWSDKAIESGYYTLSVKLKDATDDHRFLWAWNETVFILKDAATTGTWNLSEDDFQ